MWFDVKLDEKILNGIKAMLSRVVYRIYLNNQNLIQSLIIMYYEFCFVLIFFLFDYRVELTSGHWKSRATHWFGFLFWQFGHLSLGFLVYLIPNMKHLELFIGLSAVPFLTLWYFLPESPRWLLSKGRKPEAIKVLTLACKFNKKPPPSFEQLDFSIDDNDVQKGTIKGNHTVILSD